MPALAIFSLFAVAWTIYAVRWARRRYLGDQAAFTFGLVAGFGVTAVLLLVGISVGGPPSLLWTVAPVALVVLISTVLAERRRPPVKAARRAQRPS